MGAQLGSKVASRIPQRVMERGLGILFILVAALTLGEVLLIRAMIFDLDSTLADITLSRSDLKTE